LLELLHEFLKYGHAAIRPTRTARMTGRTGLSADENMLYGFAI